jgi:YesN/AraC family two-component response regulator
MVVKAELEKLGLHYSFVELGEALIEEEATNEQLASLNVSLLKNGLEILEDNRLILIEKIKTTIIELVHYTDDQIKVNLSNFLSDKLGYNYTYMANLFSDIMGITIEGYYLNHKIEKVKELLVYDELNLTEIAFKLHYSSVAHLSNQFRKMTGLTPSSFRHLKTNRRNLLGTS